MGAPVRAGSTRTLAGANRSRRLRGISVAARPNQGAPPGSRPRSPRPSEPVGENLYQLLSVPQTASSAEITNAYRLAMKRFHPDRARPEHRAGAEELSKDLNRAYKTLSNPAARLAYDQSIRKVDLRDPFMARYTGEFGGPRAAHQDPYATRLKRDITEAERRDHRRSERSAFVSLFSIFLVVTLGAIGLVLVGGLVSFLFQQLFS